MPCGLPTEKPTHKKTVARDAAAIRARRQRPEASSVDGFLAALEHPFKTELLSLRQIILGAHADIREGIKWNAPSFYTSQYFATFQLRAKDGVQVILHCGAKKRAGQSIEAAISAADPRSLLEWLGDERASVKFRDARDIAAKRSAFTRILRLWIQQL
jgi:hypothetical protein